MLRAWYKLDGDGKDSSGNGNDAILSNVTFESGKIGNCANFSTANIILDNPINSASDFTVSFWGKSNLVSTQCFGCSRYAVGEGFSIFLIEGSIRIDTNSAYHWDTGCLLSADTWTHITVVKTSSVKKLFINGTLFASTTEVPELVTFSSDYSIGASIGTSTGNYLVGK